MIQQVLAEPEWQNRLSEVDLRALSPLRWRHVNPYGTFTLNMQERLPLEQVVQIPRALPEIWGFVTLGPTRDFADTFPSVRAHTTRR